MANITYDMMWQESMAELNEQVHIEDDTIGLGDAAPAVAPVPTHSIVEAFQHFACLYIKYMQIFKKLEACYDAMLHPQKRSDVKEVLEVVMTRVVELKHLLVKWNPPNPDCTIPEGAGPERNFPWEYVNLDDILMDLKLPPEALEVPVPRYFIEDNIRRIKGRELLVRGYMNILLPPPNNNDVPVEVEEDPDDAIDFRTVEEAVARIQKNERGRQGKERALQHRDVREAEKRRRVADAPGQSNMDPDLAAANIQRLFRGFHSRAAAAAEREEELVFIGMKPPKHRSDALQRDLQKHRERRKAEQVEHQAGYTQALEDLQQEVRDEEGPLMREQMMEDRRNWFTDVMMTGAMPDDLTKCVPCCFATLPCGHLCLPKCPAACFHRLPPSGSTESWRKGKFVSGFHSACPP